MIRKGLEDGECVVNERGRDARCGLAEQERDLSDGGLGCAECVDGHGAAIEDEHAAHVGWR